MTGQRKRCRRLNEPGHAHALTFSCFRRQPFLSKGRSRQWMIEAIDKARVEHQFDLWAYVVMPEHVHLLICPTEAEYSISAILKTMKQFVSREAIHFLQHNAPEFLPHLLDRQPNGRSSYRFWQRGGGYDRNLMEPKAIWSMMEYINANPVRRGLCQSAIEWLWSSALDWEQPGSGVLRIDRGSVPQTDAG